MVISLAEEKDAGKYVCQISTYKPTEIKHTVKIRGKKSKANIQFCHNIIKQKYDVRDINRHLYPYSIILDDTLLHATKLLKLNNSSRSYPNFCSFSPNPSVDDGDLLCDV